ncbi:hypothetical protein [Acidithiobacillus ferrooxidans]|uniref:hypothetical protein n=2 Tax=Acidithiobacillaceae TaxID=225058 RepID=UPI0015E8C442|nr:hypothetical protein [Acidithiobacillus ferrooxidans]QZT52744.1 hypothetical protein K7B00_00565 [Acidithiobacillus ferrooxidans]
MTQRRVRGSGAEARNRSGVSESGGGPVQSAFAAFPRSTHATNRRPYSGCIQISQLTTSALSTATLSSTG